MKTLFKTFAVGVLVCLFGGTAAAADRGSPDEAVAMVKKAVAYMKENGKEKAFAEFANPANKEFHDRDLYINKEFHDRDLYIYVYDMKGNCIAHGNNPKMVGKNLLEMKDNSGKAIIKGFIDVANTKGKGWVDYKWPNPVTKAVELKSGYVEKAEDVIVGSGVYK